MDNTVRTLTIISGDANFWYPIMQRWAEIKNGYQLVMIKKGEKDSMPWYTMEADTVPASRVKSLFLNSHWKNTLPVLGQAIRKTLPLTSQNIAKQSIELCGSNLFGENIQVQQEQPSLSAIQSQAPIVAKLIPPPEKLRDGLVHPDFVLTFELILLKLNEINPKTNMAGWQFLKNQLVTVPFPPDLMSRLSSGNSHNQSKDLVGFIATNTEMTIAEFGEKISHIGLEKYAQELNILKSKCIEKFNSLTAQKTNNQNEVCSWCNKNKLQHLAPIFEKERIDTLADIADLTENDLEKLGIVAMGDRKKIIRFVKELKESSNDKTTQ